MHKKFPTVKLTAENAGDLELSSHRQAVTCATAAPPSSSLLASLSPLPSSLLPPPTDTEDEPRSPSKQPVPTVSSLSLDSIIVISPTMSDNASNPAPKSKKAKQTVASGDQEDIPPDDGAIINIDDIDDLLDEPLNKANPTADIKEFFVAAPHLPGQSKRLMKCDLCL